MIGLPLPLLLAVSPAQEAPWRDASVHRSRVVVVVENPGQANMSITIKHGQKLERYRSTSRMGQGGGAKAGTAYRLPDGNLLYVPE